MIHLIFYFWHPAAATLYNAHSIPGWLGNTDVNETTNLIFASDWQKFAHHVNRWKADKKAENIFLTIAIGSIVLSTTGMETSSLSWSPW